MTRWPRAKMLLLLTTLLIASLALPATAAAQPNDHANQTSHITIFTVNRVPILGINEAGVLRAQIQGSDDSFKIQWQFRGLTNGGPAIATGSGSGSWDGSAEVLGLSLDKIAAWKMPGFPEPQVPKSATVDKAWFATWLVSVSDPNAGTIVAGLPIQVIPGFDGPFANRHQFFIESSLGTGATTFHALPGSRNHGQSQFSPFTPVSSRP